MKDIVGITKIRYYLSKFKIYLNKNWDHDFDPLPKLLVKMYAHLQ